MNAKEIITNFICMSTSYLLPTELYSNGINRLTKYKNNSDNYLIFATDGALNLINIKIVELFWKSDTGLARRKVN
jgi:hypothetical protein